MKRLLLLSVVVVVAAAATGCSLFNRNSCDPCATGIGAPMSGGYTAAPTVTDGGYLPAPQ